MQMLQVADASRLAGVTAHQLKEWCGRREILNPDVPGAGRGRHALYSWQTVLAIRILHELSNRFGVEVGVWKTAIGEFRQLVSGRAFPVLWNAIAAFPDRDHAALIDEKSWSGEATILVPLAPHLKVIAEDFALPPEPQLHLFPALGLRQ